MPLYLIREEYPLYTMMFIGLHPRVAREMYWTTCKVFNSHALQEELLLVLVSHCDRTWHPKIGVYNKFSCVIYSLCLKI